MMSTNSRRTALTGKSDLNISKEKPRMPWQDLAVSVEG